jgi:hypothetical protein
MWCTTIERGKGPAGLASVRKAGLTWIQLRQVRCLQRKREAFRAA